MPNKDMDMGHCNIVNIMSDDGFGDAIFLVCKIFYYFFLLFIFF